MEVDLDYFRRRHIGFTDFIRKIDTEERAFEFFKLCGIINYRNAVCWCGNKHLLRNKDRSMKSRFRWRCVALCHQTSVKINPLQNTWFEKAHIPYLKNLELLLHWYFRLNVEITMVDTNSSTRSTVGWRCSAREVCAIANLNNKKKIGGPGHFVEIDETHLFRRKHNRGHRIRGESVWILGVDRTTKERFLCRVPNRKKITMWPILKRNVAPGSIVITDDHKSYKGIEQYLRLEGHEVVVHRYGFNNPLFPDIYTNTIESIWRPLKRMAKRSGSDATIDLYINEFLYRSRLQVQYGKRKYGEKFLHFMEDIRKTYPAPHKIVYKT